MRHGQTVDFYIAVRLVTLMSGGNLLLQPVRVKNDGLKLLPSRA